MVSLVDLTWYQPQCESAQGEAQNTQMRQAMDKVRGSTCNMLRINSALDTPLN
jgi:hypothetical protein